jgi:hypothetical protein
MKLDLVSILLVVLGPILIAALVGAICWWIGRVYPRLYVWQEDVCARMVQRARDQQSAALERMLKHRQDLPSLRMRVRFYERAGRNDEAARWRERLRQSEEWHSLDEDK